jgi:hypothetical protein
MATRNTNFAQAAIRHWDSSRQLKDAGRLQDAAYLAGYVGECALKAVMVALDSPSDPKAYGHDLEALSGDALETAALFASGIGRYSDIAAPLTAIEWKPEWRYEGNVASPDSFATAFGLSHKIGLSLLFALALDGLLEEDLT